MQLEGYILGWQELYAYMAQYEEYPEENNYLGFRFQPRISKKVYEEFKKQQPEAYKIYEELKEQSRDE